jgi:hypothetical protein
VEKKTVGDPLSFYGRAEHVGKFERSTKISAGKDFRQVVKADGRPEWIRTIDLFRVKEALWTN